MSNLILHILNFNATTSDMTFILVSSFCGNVCTVFKDCRSPSLSIWCHRGYSTDLEQNWSWQCILNWRKTV